MLILTCFPPHSLTDAGIQTQVACKELAARHSVLPASSSPMFEPGRAPTRGLQGWARMNKVIRLFLILTTTTLSTGTATYFIGRYI